MDMDGSKALGVAGYIYVVPIALGALGLLIFYFSQLNVLVDESTNIESKFLISAIVIGLVYVCALFLSIPGLLLIAISEIARAHARQVELLANISSQLSWQSG